MSNLNPSHPFDLPPVPAGWYRVFWVADLPKNEFDSAGEAALEAASLAGPGGDSVANTFHVLDGDTGEVTEHDLAS